MSADIPADNVALSFQNVGISTLYPPNPILSNVSGYVRKGGMTASKFLAYPYRLLSFSLCFSFSFVRSSHG
jgi:hypothetical protein